MRIAGVEVLEERPKQVRHEAPVLFVHGAWAAAWVWREWLAFFAARGYAAYALNLRGHTFPLPEIGRVSVSESVAEVRAVAVALGRPILVGHSLGGLLVQKVAEDTDLTAVVAIGPAAPRGILAISNGTLLAAAVRHIHELVLRRPILPTKAEFARLDGNCLPEEVHDALYARLVPDSGRQLFEASVTGVAVDASKVRAPILCLVGSEDRFTPPQVVHRIARKYSAHYREYPGHAHLIVVESGWEAVAADAATWLESVAHDTLDEPDVAELVLRRGAQTQVDTHN